MVRVMSIVVSVCVCVVYCQWRFQPSKSQVSALKISSKCGLFLMRGANTLGLVYTNLRIGHSPASHQILRPHLCYVNSSIQIVCQMLSGSKTVLQYHCSWAEEVFSVLKDYRPVALLPIIIKNF